MDRDGVVAAAEAATVQCRLGHAVPRGQAYCGLCGAPTQDQATIARPSRLAALTRIPGLSTVPSSVLRFAVGWFVTVLCLLVALVVTLNNTGDGAGDSRLASGENGDVEPAAGSPFSGQVQEELNELPTLYPQVFGDLDLTTGRCNVLLQIVADGSTRSGTLSAEDVRVTISPGGGLFNTISNATNDDPEALDSLTECRDYLVGQHF